MTSYKEKVDEHLKKLREIHKNKIQEDKICKEIFDKFIEEMKPIWEAELIIREETGVLYSDPITCPICHKRPSGSNCSYCIQIHQTKQAFVSSKQREIQMKMVLIRQYNQKKEQLNQLENKQPTINITLDNHTRHQYLVGIQDEVKQQQQIENLKTQIKTLEDRLNSI